jgi:hypothetical protein
MPEALVDGFTVRRTGFPRMSLDLLVDPDLRRRCQSVPPRLGLFRTSCDNLVTSAVDMQSSPAPTQTPRISGRGQESAIRRLVRVDVA